MPVSKAHMEATRRFEKKAYERIAFNIRRDAEVSGDVIRRYAESKNLSVNALIRVTLEERIRNDPDFVI